MASSDSNAGNNDGQGAAPRRRFHYNWNSVGAILAVLIFFVIAVYHAGISALLAVAGETVTAEVVDVQHGAGGDDFVRVHVPAPEDRELDLRVWAGEPEVGESLEVRYVHWLALAVDGRLNVPWHIIAISTLGMLAGVHGVWLYGIHRRGLIFRWT